MLKTVLSLDPATSSRVDEILDFAENPGIVAKCPAKHPPRILKGTEAASMLGVCPRTLKNWVDTGKLRPFKAPGKDRSSGYLESDILEFLQRCSA